MGIRNPLAGNQRKNAEIRHFRNGLPRQSVPQGHLLRGADWLAMTDFFDSLEGAASADAAPFLLTFPHRSCILYLTKREVLLCPTLH